MSYNPKTRELLSDGVPLGLIGATVHCRISRDGDQLVDRDVAILGRGLVACPVPDEPGTYLIDYEVRWPDGRQQAVPHDSYHEWTVHPEDRL